MESFYYRSFLAVYGMAAAMVARIIVEVVMSVQPSNCRVSVAGLSYIHHREWQRCA
jgi:hypothetical protein